MSASNDEDEEFEERRDDLDPVKLQAKYNFNLDEWRSDNTSSGYKGVYFHKHTGRWQAGSSGGCTGLLGYYHTTQEAAVVFAHAFNQLKATGIKRPRPPRYERSGYGAAAKKKRANPPVKREPQQQPRQRPRMEQPKELFCICQAPQDDDLFYLGCDGCGGWFHPECLGMDPEEARVAASLPEWHCHQCSPRLDHTTQKGKISQRCRSWWSYALEDGGVHTARQGGKFSAGLQWLCCPTESTS